MNPDSTGVPSSNRENDHHSAGDKQEKHTWSGGNMGLYCGIAWLAWGHVNRGWGWGLQEGRGLDLKCPERLECYR